MSGSVHDLARWTRFAAKGGIGRCSATVDCVAREIGDLMFLKDDEIIVLMQLPEAGYYLGFCEGVVGRFSGADVQFHEKLKRPIMAKRVSLAVADLRSNSLERVSPSCSEDLSGTGAESLNLVSPGSSAAKPGSSSESRTRSSTAKRKPLSPDMHLHSSSPEYTKEHRRSRGRAQELRVSVSSAYSAASTPSDASTMFSDAEDWRDGEDSEVVPPLSGPGQASSSTKSVPTSSSSVDSMSISSSNSVQATSSAQPITSLDSTRASSSRSMERFLQSLSNLSPASHSTSGSVSVSASESMSGTSRDSSSIYGSPASTPTSNSTSSANINGLTVAPLRLAKSPRLATNLGSPPLSPLPPQFTLGPSLSQPGQYAISSPSPTSPRSLSLAPRTPLSPSFTLPAASSPPRSPLPLPPSPPSTASSAPEPTSEEDESSLYDRGHDSTRLSTLHHHLEGTDDDEDGETGIGLSLLGALAMDEEDEEDEEGTGGIDREVPEVGDRLVGYNLNNGSEEGTVTAESTPIPWTKYTPVSASPTIGHAPHTLSNEATQDRSMVMEGEPEQRGQERAKSSEEADEDDEEGYWDRASDIYDDYRYSRYSMVSKRISAMSVKSKSRVSTLSGDVVPPVPSLSPDRPSFDITPRPSVSSGRPSVSSASSWSRPDRVNVLSTSTHSSVYSRPSLESSSSADPGSPVTLEPIPHSPVDGPEVYLRPPVARKVSADNESESARTPSMYSTRTLSPLSAQFPKIPTSVSSRLRGTNVDSEDESEGEGEASGKKKMPLQAINPVSPLLYASFGANGRHSGYTEETERRSSSAYSESDEGHGLRKSRVRRSDAESVRSSTSPTDTSRSSIASALRVRTESEREAHVGLETRAIVVDDDYDEQRPVGTSEDVQTDEGVEGETSSTTSEAVGSTGHDAVTLASLLPPSTGTPSAHTTPGTPAALTPGTSLMTTTPGAHLVPETPSALTPRTPSAPTPDPPSTPSSETATSDQGAAPPSTLRPRQPNQTSHPFSRTSIFLPHPNAPKIAPGVATLGPMYARPQQAGMSPNASPGVFPPVQPPPNATAFSLQVLRYIRSLSLGPGGRRSPMTLYARCEPDLNQSPSPVPIMFSIDPFPSLPYMPPQSATASSNGQPALPTRAATVSTPTRRSSTVPGALAPGRGAPTSSTEDISLNGSADTSGPSPLRLPRRSATMVASTQELTVNDNAPVAPISRPDFVPQVGASRPRSRSFSGFGEAANVSNPPEQSREEPVSKAHSGMSVTGAPVLTPPPSSTLSKASGLPASLRTRHAPSPLSLQSGSNLSDERRPTAVGSYISTPSPSAGQLKSPTSPSLQQLSPVPSAMQFGLKPPFTGSASASPVPLSPAMSISSPFHFSDREKNGSPASATTGRTSVSTYAHDVASPQPWVKNARHGSMDAPRKNSVDGAPPRNSCDSTDEVSSPPPITDSQSQSTRSLPSAHEMSLRGKLSLPALRMRSKLDDTVSMTSSSGNQESETVQVQDMDFELVKPSLPQVPLGRSSQESSYTGHDADAIGTIQGDTMSMHSNAPRSPMVPNAMSSEAPLTESSTSIDAHRQREGKWMALLPVVPSSQARKNKKVKRLLLEGVPSSVRYLVWCHLTDSKARAIPGVYAQLGRRARVAAFSDIERDAKTYFPEQAQLHSCDGPLVSLLQAYLSMVPDVQYSSGLTSIAGHLLLLSPEEDAFWIFASMMDAHLRPYFAVNTIQLEVDAALLSRAIENNDPGVNKKLYVTLGIAAAEVARPWFSTLFVGTLPVDYLHRIWDIFLYEGVTLLIRVGLTLVQCVRHLLLQTTSGEAAMEYLIHPPLACLPSTAETFLHEALSMKLKDDDVRKQRIKMESQLKRKTQSRSNGSSGMQTASISLPKAPL